MPRLSILIPAVGDVPALESTLLSVLENRPRGCEIIVALGISYDNPYRLDDEVKFVSSHGGGWAKCVQRGLGHCRGAYVHVLQSGVLATPNWTASALTLFTDLQVAAVSPVVRRAMARSSSSTAIPSATTATIGVRLNWTGNRVEVNNGASSESVLGPTHWAGFYRREALVEIGGVSTAVGGELADVDLAWRLLEHGHRTAVASDSQVRLQRDTSAAASAFHGGVHAERLYRRRRNGVAGRNVTALGHGIGILAEIAAAIVRPSNLLRLAGRVMGAATVGSETPLHADGGATNEVAATVSWTPQSVATTGHRPLTAVRRRAA